MRQYDLSFTAFQHPGQAPAARHGGVVLLTVDDRAFTCAHEQATRMAIGKRLARLQRQNFCGEYDHAGAYTGRLYFVPSETLSSVAHAQAYGIRGARDLFGGIVPFPFVATKAITHPLPSSDARRPAGWAERFAQLIQDAVLPGFTAFSLPDLQQAGRMLLEIGPVRIKPVRATGGKGQRVVYDTAALDAALRTFNEEEIGRDGVVLETNLTKPKTLSVGQVRVGTLTISYHGVQRLTHDNAQELVYAGSDLTVVRGDFGALLAQPLSADVRLAVRQAREYHDAVVACYAGFCASRVNYDVAQGCISNGQWRSGVLEQSWRLGGASGAEVAALEVFDAQPERRTVRASTYEVYGHDAVAPDHATVHYCGIDADVGPIAKYSLVHEVQ